MAEQAKKIVPSIRFKGFSEEWEKNELGEVLTERKVLQKISNDAPILAFASGQGVIDRNERRSNNRDHLTRDQANKIYKLTEYDDIVYNPANLKYGAIDRNKHGRGVISPIYVTFITEEESSFIELIVKSEKFKLRALLYEEGTVVKRQSVKPENLLSLNIHITLNPEEQAQIGNFFQKIDQMIGLHQRKHEKLLTLKKAMLKKMFPQNEATTPEIRFKCFSKPWEEKKLGECAKFSKGQGYSKGDLVASGAPIVLYGRLYTNYQTEISEVDTFVIENIGSVKSTGKEVIVPSSGETPEDIARASAIVKAGLLLGGDLNIILPSSKIDSCFLALTISNGTPRKDLEKRAQGKTVVHIRNSDLETVTVRYPAMEEQQKIGAYFRQLDELIEQHGTQLTKLKQIKTACLEKMFV